MLEEAHGSNENPVFRISLAGEIEKPIHHEEHEEDNEIFRP